MTKIFLIIYVYPLINESHQRVPPILETVKVWLGLFHVCQKNMCKQIFMFMVCRMNSSDLLTFLANIVFTTNSLEIVCASSLSTPSCDLPHYQAKNLRKKILEKIVKSLKLKFPMVWFSPAKIMTTTLSFR